MARPKRAASKSATEAGLSDPKDDNKNEQTQVARDANSSPREDSVAQNGPEGNGNGEPPNLSSTKGKKTLDTAGTLSTIPHNAEDSEEEAAVLTSWSRKSRKSAYHTSSAARKPSKDTARFTTTLIRIQKEKSSSETKKELRDILKTNEIHIPSVNIVEDNNGFSIFFEDNENGKANLVKFWVCADTPLMRAYAGSTSKPLDLTSNSVAFYPVEYAKLRELRSLLRDRLKRSGLGEFSRIEKLEKGAVVFMDDDENGKKRVKDFCKTAGPAKLRGGRNLGEIMKVRVGGKIWVEYDNVNTKKDTKSNKEIKKDTNKRPNDETGGTEARKKVKSDSPSLTHIKDISTLKKSRKPFVAMLFATDSANAGVKWQYPLFESLWNDKKLNIKVDKNSIKILWNTEAGYFLQGSEGARGELQRWYNHYRHCGIKPLDSGQKGHLKEMFWCSITGEEDGDLE